MTNAIINLSRTRKDWYLPLLPLGISAVVITAAMVWFYSVDQSGSYSSGPRNARASAPDKTRGTSEQAAPDDKSLTPSQQRMVLASVLNEAKEEPAVVRNGTDFASNPEIEPLSMSQARARESLDGAIHPSVVQMDKIVEEPDDGAPDIETVPAEMPDEGSSSEAHLRELPAMDELVSDSEPPQKMAPPAEAPNPRGIGTDQILSETTDYYLKSGEEEGAVEE